MSDTAAAGRARWWSPVSGVGTMMIFTWASTYYLTTRPGRGVAFLAAAALPLSQGARPGC